MRKNALKSMPTEERHRQNWIKELQEFGVTTGPNNEPLESMSYFDLRGLVLKEHLKRD